MVYIVEYSELGKYFYHTQSIIQYIRLSLDVLQIQFVC